MLAEMCTTVVTGMVTRLSTLLAESLLLKTQPSGNAVDPMIITILSPDTWSTARSEHLVAYHSGNIVLPRDAPCGFAWFSPRFARMPLRRKRDIG